MTDPLSDGIHRSDLAHGGERLVVTGTMNVRHTGVTMHIDDHEGLDFLLDTVLDQRTGPTTVSLRLAPRDYNPETLTEPEFPPSNLIFGVDQRASVAAVAILAVDRDHRSHQWLPYGEAWETGVAPLAVDPTIPDDTRFDRAAHITLEQLRTVVTGWAWGSELPPAGVPWRTAIEHEVRWSCAA